MPDKNTLVLALLQPNDKAVINMYQIPMVIQDLWQLELNPNHSFEVKKVSPAAIEVEMEGRKIEIGMEIAQKVCVEKLFSTN
ncbi:MAG: FeoA domain-containing protein [Cytophagales bacterium]